MQSVNHGVEDDRSKLKNRFQTRIQHFHHADGGDIEIYVHSSQDSVVKKYHVPHGNLRNLAEWEFTSFMLPATVQNISTLGIWECCLCQGGSIYLIPASTSQRVLLSKESRRVVQPDHNANSEYEQAIYLFVEAMSSSSQVIHHHITAESLLFAKENIVSIDGFRNGLIVCLQSKKQWIMEIYLLSLNQPKLNSQPSLSFRVHRREDLNDVPIMKLFSPSQSSQLAGSTCSCNTLDPSLMGILFGEELLLLHGEIFLIGFPDGRVLFCPLKGRSHSDVRNRQNLQLLCVLTQPVKGIYCCSLVQDAGMNDSSSCGLVVVGIQGQVVLFTKNANQCDGYRQVTFFNFPAPIVSLSMCHSRAVIIDGTATWLMLFMWKANVKEKAAVIVPVKCFLENVSAIDIVESCGQELLVTCNNLELPLKILPLRLLQDCKSTDDNLNSELNEGSAQWLVSQIRNISSEIKNILNHSDIQQKILKEIASAAHVFHNRHNISKSFTSECEPAVEIKAGILHISLSLKFTNVGPFSISGSNWILCTVITPSKMPPFAWKKIKSTPLSSGIAINETLCDYIVFYVESNAFLEILPLSVTFYLQFNALDHYLGKKTNCLMAGDITSMSPVFQVAAAQHYIDIFNFLQSLASVDSVLFGRSNIENALHTIALKRRNAISRISSSCSEHSNHYASSAMASTFFSYHSHHVKDLMMYKTLNAVESVPSKVLQMLLSDAKFVSLQAECSEINLFLLGHPFKIVVAERDEHVKITFTTSPVFFNSLQASVFIKMQHKMVSNQKTVASSSRVTLPLKPLYIIQEIQLLMGHLGLSPDDCISANTLLRLYQEIRDSSSSYFII